MDLAHRVVDQVRGPAHGLRRGLGGNNLGEMRGSSRRGFGAIT
jgi:hypothetical protein